MGDGPARNERRDMFVFLGFVALLLTTIAVVALVRKDWPETRWVALGSLAATVQAVGVVAALVVAWAQIRNSRDEARRRRRDELIDRLQAAVHEALLPAWSAVQSRWDGCFQLIEMAKTEEESENLRAWLRAEFDRDRDGLHQAMAALSAASSRTRRVLQLLGEAPPTSLRRLDTAPISLPDLPRRFDDAVEGLDHEPASLAKGDQAASELRHWVNSYIAQHVESGRVTRSPG